jgi:hypothetical protein
MAHRVPQQNKPKSKAEPDTRPRSLRTPPAEGSPYHNIKLILPVWYIQLIDDEARRLNYARRAHFLEFLVQVYAGRVDAKRAASAPPVTPPSAKELVREQMYMWHCPIETKKLLDEILARSGGVNPKAWVIVALNEWVGLPPIARLG